MAQQLVANATFKPHSRIVNACAISPDGTLLATGSHDGLLLITDIATQARVYTVKSGNYVWDVAWSPDGTRLVAVTGGLVFGSGHVIEVTINKSHSTVYTNDAVFHRDPCCDESVTLLDPSNNYEVIEKLTGISVDVYRVAFSPDSKLLAVGCQYGHLYIYGLANGKWGLLSHNNHHTNDIRSLCFSPSGGMLLATSNDNTASIWNVPNGTTWPTTPHVTLKHTNTVTGGAFFGDESHVITGDCNGYLSIWRASDGIQTPNDPYSGQVRSLSLHAASGNIAFGTLLGYIELWQMVPQSVPSPSPQVSQAAVHAAFQAVVQAVPRAAVQAAPPAHVCVRERLAEAQAEADKIHSLLESADIGLRQQMSREKELKQSIADLEAKLASEKEALAEMQTDHYIAQSSELTKMKERHDELCGIIHVCTQTLDSLADCLSVSGIEDLRGGVFREWLCDIGMSKLQTALKDMDGNTLTMLIVSDVTDDYDVTFNDAAALQLRAYIAHYRLSEDSAFAPPPGSVLSWDKEQTANWILSLEAPFASYATTGWRGAALNWIKSLRAPFASLAAAGWHGAALCSLTAPLIIKASNGALKAADAVKFLGFVRAQRRETDGDKDEWVANWTGTSSIEMQAV